MKATALYEKIYNEMLEAIQGGRYAPDQRLPSEKELAEMYGVSRITSQKALNMLAEGGYIIRLPGKGSYISVPGGKASTPQSSAAAGRTRIIGYIVRGVGPSYGLQLLCSLEAECRKHGYVLAIRFASTEAEEERCIDELLAAGASGLIVICIHGENYSERILRLVLDHYPIVLLDRGLQGIPVSYVGSDNHRAAAELTEYLLGQGLRQLCCVSCRVNQRDISVIADREQGLRDTLMRRGMPVDEAVDFLRLEHEGFVRDRTAADKNIQRLIAYIQAHPEKDGYLCTSYDAAEETAVALDRLGMEKQIVCFGQIDSLLLQHSFPHVKQDEWAMGREAVRIVLEAIAGHTKPQKVIVPHHLMTP